MPWDLLARTTVREILQIVQANMLDYTTSCVWLRANYDFTRIDQMNIVTRRGRTNYIQYNPDAACGGSWVYIENQATASLYNYTPYQPNQRGLWMLVRELHIVELMAIETSGGSSMNGSVLR